MLINARDIVFVSLLFLASLICTGCSGGSGSSSQATTPDFSKLTPACFAASASNLILTRDSLFAGSDWNDPSVIKVGSQYVMYASSGWGSTRRQRSM